MKQVSTMGLGETQIMETTKQVSEMQPSASQNKEPEQQAKQKKKTEEPVEMSQSHILFEYAMEDKWQELVKVYKSHTECHEAKITKAEDTALHLAVSGGKLDIVRQLVATLTDQNASNVLKAKNKKGDTPLHIAAALGNVGMCHYIALNDYNLIAKKNDKKETPVYLAACFGHKDAFLCLYLICCKGNRPDVCESRDANGDTILHAAIHGEHFDLAFQILCKYPDLANAVNTDGLSPLHILARKGDAFLSGSRLGWFDRILYRCVIVDEEKEKFKCVSEESEKNYRERLVSQYMERFEERGPYLSSFPQNYGTCVRFFQMFWGVVCYGVPSPCPKPKATKERGDQQPKAMEDEQPKAMEERGEQLSPVHNHKEDHLPLLANCATFIQMFNFVKKLVLFLLGLERRFVSYIKHYKKSNGNINTVVIDEENPRDESSSSESKSEPNNSHDPGKEPLGNTDPGSSTGTSQKPGHNEERKLGYLPANYATFTRFFKFLVKFVLVVFGLGFRRIKKVTTKKQRHRWATQVMDKLIDKASTYKYFGGQTGSGKGEIMTKDFPLNPSQMTDQDTSPGDVKSSSIQTSDKKGVSQHEADSNRKEVNAALMVKKFLHKYNITGTVDSKNLKHALKMKFERKVDDESTKPKTPILIAASNGITEIVEKILEKFPVAIQDEDAENKNVLLLAVENRQTHTFQFLIERQVLHESVFYKWDNQGNNALHLAATYGHYRPWLIPGSALQMQWELKWYEFVKKSMAKHLLVHYNKKGQTPKQIFTETHKALVKDGSEWLTKTSESCSVIAALIATVAFATAANIPGGANDQTGLPVLRDHPAFGVFAISSLVALCFSLTALVYFLAILTSRFEEKDFAKKLPRILILGLTSLFTSIAAMLASFCAGHFFELRGELKLAALPIYTATCLPISLFALAQLPLYFDLLLAICTRVPRRGYKEIAF